MIVLGIDIGLTGAVAACVIDGLTHRQTAAATGLREVAVRGYIRRLIARFDVQSKRDLALRLMWCDWREVEVARAPEGAA